MSKYFFGGEQVSEGQRGTRLSLPNVSGKERTENWQRAKREADRHRSGKRTKVREKAKR